MKILGFKVVPKLDAPAVMHEIKADVVYVDGSSQVLYAAPESPPDYVDALAICQMSEYELGSLGLKNGWACIFGERQ